MNCPNCNEVLPDGSKFCANCGTKMAAMPQPQPAPPQSAPAPLPTQTQQPNQAANQDWPAPTQQPGTLMDPRNPLGQPLTPLSNTNMTPTYNVQQAVSERNWLENLMNKIPGYKGYQDKETRRDVDKLHREHLATMLSQLKPQIHSVVRELSDNRRLFETGPIERSLNKLDKIENRIRYASYGYTGFFDVVKIKEAQLDQLYHFDVALVDEVELVKAQVQNLVAKVDDAKALKTAALDLEKSLDALSAKFDQRYQAIENPGFSPF